MQTVKGKISIAHLAADENRQWCVAKGWVASVEKKKISLLVKDEKGNILEYKEEPLSSEGVDSYTGFRREEIKSFYGFLLRIYLPTDWKKIFVYAVDGAEELLIYSESRAYLEKIYNNSVQQLWLDGWKKGDEESVIRGWCFHKLKPFRLDVYNSDGSKLNPEIFWTRRVDLEKVYLISNPKKVEYGFVIHIPNSDLKTNKIKLVVSSEDGITKKTIDLSKEKKQESQSLLRKILSPKKWIKAVLFLKTYGKDAFIEKLKNANDDPDVKYHKWFLAHRVTEMELEEQRKHTFVLNPKISIVIPLYNTKREFLKDILDSVLYQSYANWELCLADGSTDLSVGEYVKNNYSDDRIVYKKLEKNEGIAGNTNVAFSMATGDFVVLSDHDDILERDALFEIVKLYNENPKLEIIYTDEDLTEETGKRFSSPRFKPDFNLDFLQSINYICHIFAVKKAIMDQVGGFRTEYDGAQDWDLILRCCELSEHIGHVPKILYHWRAHQQSTAGNIDSKQYAIDAGKKAVEDHFKRIGVKAELAYTGIFVAFRPKLFPDGEPKISIIIANKDQKETLQTCVDSIREKSTYPNYEIIIVENNSTTDEIFEYYKELEQDSRIKVVTYEGGFNYSRINNLGAREASGEYLILLNNDTEVISPDWMERMVGYCQRESTGIVGAKLYYPDDTVQHCGVVVGMGGFAGHVLMLSSPSDDGYFGRLKVVQDISAVTAACLMIKKTVFDEVGGLDEDFIVALNDVDLCLKVRKAGKLIVLDPGIELYHYESKSRGFEETPEKHARFKEEIKRFRNKWADMLKKGDEYYNPNLSLVNGDCSIKAPDENFAIVQEIEEEN